MTTFVDTSPLLAVVNAGDPEHAPAHDAWTHLLDTTTALRTHNYVVVEAAALVQRRFGMAAASRFHEEVTPGLSIRFVESALHERATAALLAAGRRRLSLVDWTSFELMRDEGITEAFAFDDDFVKQAFDVRP